MHHRVSRGVRRVVGSGRKHVFGARGVALDKGYSLPEVAAAPGNPHAGAAKAVQELEEQLDALLSSAYGRGVRHNRAEHTFRLPNGAIIECGQLDGPNAYKKFQGRSFTLLVVDEFGLLRDRRWVDLLKSNLRAEEGVPLREIRTANPGGPLHAMIHHNYIARAPAWHPYEVDGETWVNCPSTFIDNPHVDQQDYRRRLLAACGNDEELARAWLTAPDGKEATHRRFCEPPPSVLPWKPLPAGTGLSLKASAREVCVRRKAC